MNTNIDIKLTLELHAKWLKNEEGGVKADLRGANLSNADLSGADLSNADLRGADLRYADLRYADLSKADLRGADLSNADLRYADLSNANLDFSTGFSLSCYGSRFTASIKLAYQYLAHICTIIPTEDEKEEFNELKRLILPLALKSHRASDLNIEKINID